MILWMALLSATTTTTIPDEPKADRKSEAVARSVDSLLGNWVGTLSVPPGIELQMIYRVTKADGKPIAATLDVPDQGAKGIPVDTVGLEGEEATLGVKLIAGDFQGKLSADGSALVGRWKQGSLALPLTLKKVDRVPDRLRPQMPRPPFPYKTEDVTYPSKASGVKLAATLTIPEGKGPFPAVVFITGSGPQDRDESLLGHKPFLVLADALARRGIVTLRADDRGFGRSTGNFASATTEDFADDAQGGVEFLKGRPEVDPGRVGMIGHSEGGIVGPIVAARAPDDVAFLVLLAGTGLTGAEILRLQGVDLLKAAGADEKTLEIQGQALDAILPIVVAEEDPEELGAKIKAALDPILAKLSEAERKAQAEASPVEATVARLASPWMRHFLAFDPRPTLAKVRCPVLALNGELDMQVAAKANLESIARSIRSGGNEQVVTREFPKLNHLFQTCQTGALSEYGRIEETMAPVVLKNRRRLDPRAAWSTTLSRPGGGAVLHDGPLNGLARRARRWVHLGRDTQVSSSTRSSSLRIREASGRPSSGRA